jgi:hypothetical protein
VAKSNAWQVPKQPVFRQPNKVLTPRKVAGLALSVPTGSTSFRRRAVRQGVEHKAGSSCASLRAILGDLNGRTDIDLRWRHRIDPILPRRRFLAPRPRGGP